MKAIIVGAGASGLLHALAFRAAGVAIEAVYDPDDERARALADLCGARVTRDFASADAELAAVCSPPAVHVEQAERLAPGGRTVFVEKPVATTLGGLERLARLPRCVPILQWRAGRSLRALRRAVGERAFGDVPVVSSDLAWGRDEAYFEARRDWRCPAILSIGIHAIDAMVWMLGRDVERTAGIIGDRSAVALFAFAGGATASLRISLEGGADTTRLTICGGGRTAALAGPEADPTASPLAWSAADAECLRALEAATAGATGSPLLVPYLGAAVSALRDGEKPGDSPRLFAIADAFSAHAAALALVEERSFTPDVPRAVSSTARSRQTERPRSRSSPR